MGAKVDGEENGVAAAYDKHYTRKNYFAYRRWLYRPYIKALVVKLGLEPGARILDVGCGQGFFTGLFADMGLDALGIDISSEGIRAALRECGDRSRVRLLVGDIRKIDLKEEFDCVFTRSCSLYNTDEFAVRSEVSEDLMKVVKPGGLLVFDYYSRPCSSEKGSAWRYHSFEDVQSHFSGMGEVQCFFSSRVDTVLFGSFALSRQMTKLNLLVARRIGIGGELLAMVRKPLFPDGRRTVASAMQAQ